MGKLSQLRRILTEQKLDAIIITHPINRRYLTKFTGTAGVVIVSQEKQFFITDFRYVEQAAEQAKDFTIIEHTKSIDLEIATQLKELQAHRVGFEEHDITYAEYRRYEKLLDCELIPVSDAVEQLRVIKSADELSIMKKAAQIADEAFNHIQSYIKPGVKEIDIANELEFFMRKQGATSSSFSIIVASGHRSALPHGVATDKVIESGDFVTLDYGALFNGYISDITRTVAVGEPSEKLKEIYAITLEAQKRALAEIKAGMTGIEADRIARDYIAEHGYGEAFGHSTGHGIGLEVHEAPGLSFKSETVLEPNMVVTVEPGIYLPQIGGVRIEDDIIITENGNERLTFATKELLIL